MFLFDPPPAEGPSPDALSRAVADARLLYRNARLPWGIREGLDVCLWEIGSGKPIPPHFETIARLPGNLGSNPNAAALK